MLYLITGGSGSGKSKYAEDLIRKCGEDRSRIYIATMNPGNDPENIARVKKHRDRREDMHFTTIECPTGLHQTEIPAHAAVLLEDLSNLLANELFLPGASGIHSVGSILHGIDHILDFADDLVIVTNEIFSDGGNYDNYTRLYQEFLGSLNQELALRADFAAEIVYGIPVILKNAGSGVLS